MVQVFSIIRYDKKINRSLCRPWWTQMDMETYAKERYHLVNQFTANMVRDSEPDIPQPGDLEWLTSHPAVVGTGKTPQTQVQVGQKKRRP